MKRTVIAVLILAVSAVLSAQEKAADPIVAVINGETITKSKLDTLYGRISPQMRAQYEKAGGKMAFLDNYIGKRLIVQEAMKTKYEQQPHVKAAVEAARESALFDNYIRDVVASEIITESMLRDYYTAHAANFPTAEAVKARHIVVLFQPGRSKEAAMEKITAALNEIRGSLKVRTPELTSRAFATVAAKYSEDATRTQGGDLGWFEKGTMDPSFEEAAFRLSPNLVSGVVETKFGYHLILVEGHREAGTRPFEEVRNDIREVVMTQKMADVMTAVQRMTGELRRASNVAIYRENLQ